MWAPKEVELLGGWVGDGEAMTKWAEIDVFDLEEGGNRDTCRRRKGVSQNAYRRVMGSGCFSDFKSLICVCNYSALKAR
jgi:hypothetical protein